jgi:hypothetical protein
MKILLPVKRVDHSTMPSSEAWATLELEVSSPNAIWPTVSLTEGQIQTVIQADDFLRAARAAWQLVKPARLTSPLAETPKERWPFKRVGLK